MNTNVSSLPSLRSLVTSDPSNRKGLDLTRGLIKVRVRPFLFQKSHYIRPLPRIKIGGKVQGNRLARPQKAHAQTATVILLTSTIKIPPKHLGPYGLDKRKGRSRKSFFIAKREEGKIKQTKQNFKTKPRNRFQDTKVPILVHIL